MSDQARVFWMSTNILNMLVSAAIFLSIVFTGDGTITDLAWLIMFGVAILMGEIRLGLDSLARSRNETTTPDAAHHNTSTD